MQRLHAPTKAATMGLACALLGAALWLGVHDRSTGAELVVIMLIFITAPLSAFNLSKVFIAHHARPGELPPTAQAPTGQRWTATRTARRASPRCAGTDPARPPDTPAPAGIPSRRRSCCPTICAPDGTPRTRPVGTVITGSTDIMLKGQVITQPFSG